MQRDAVLERARVALAGVRSHEYREIGWPYRHGRRTANLALWLRARLFPEGGALDDRLHAAALFHDCAKEDDSDHGLAGSRKVGEYLRELVSAEDLAVIERAIYRHNKRGREPATDLEKLLQDADIIDHFGAIEVWLNVSYSVLSGSGPERSVGFYENYWQEMIDELSGQFNFELSSRIFQDRIRYNEEYSRRLAVESVGGVYGEERFLPGACGSI